MLASLAVRDLVRISLLLAAIALTGASATAPKQRTIKTTTTIAASPVDTFAALGELFAKRGWKLLTQDKPTGLVETEWVRVDAAHADCGSAPLGKDHETKAHVVARIAKAPDGGATVVTLDTSYQRARTFDGQAQIIDCTSKGTLETQLFADLDSHIKVLATLKEKAAAEAARAPFYCAAARADATTTWCARNELACEAGRAEIQKVVGDATPCAKSEQATCFIGTTPEGVQTERCYTTAEQCAAQRTKVKGPPPQLTDIGECST